MFSLMRGKVEIYKLLFLIFHHRGTTNADSRGDSLLKEKRSHHSCQKKSTLNICIHLLCCHLNVQVYLLRRAETETDYML